MSNDVRLQSSLGGISRFERKDHKMIGLYVGRVTKVYHKNHTADVVLLENKDQIVGSEINDGISACKILERHAGWDSEMESFYGSSTPIQIGELVVVAFLNNYKARPIILGALHDADNDKTPFPQGYPLDEMEQDEKYANLSVTRTQDYRLIKGSGELELVHHSKAFLIASERGVDDSINGFDFSDLSIKNKLTGEVVGIPLVKRPFQPLDFLISLRDSIQSTANFLKLWISAKTGEFRLSKIKSDNTLTTTEISEDGAFTVTRQLDSNIKGESSDYASMSLKSSGEVTIIRSAQGNDTIITIGESGGVKISSKGAVEVSSSKGIDISASSNVNITSSSRVNITSSSRVDITAPKVRIS